MSEEKLHKMFNDAMDEAIRKDARTVIPTKKMAKQLGYQVEIFNKEEASEYFKASNSEDCRMNAYPSFAEYHGINRANKFSDG
jgi:hypothetical protein